MKTILIFRSSNLNVLKKLNIYIKNNYSDDYKINMIVQSEAYDIVKEEYKNVKFILTNNGFFSYEKYMKNIKLKENIKKEKYDAIYIPTSTVGKNCGREIHLIANDIGAKYIFVFDCLGNIHKINNSKYFIIIKDKTYKIINHLQNCFKLILFYVIYLLCIIYSNIYWKGKKKDARRIL